MQKRIEELEFANKQLFNEQEKVCEVVASQRDRAFEHVRELGTRIAELEQERRWIPISERLPEIFGWYLVYGRDASTRRNINVEYFRLNSKTFSGGFHITHWKYLPHPPKEEE